MDRTLNPFTIDVDAEIRKLSFRRHTSSSGPILDLIRLAASFGPSAIDIRLTRRRTIIRARDATPNQEIFLLALRVFDRNRRPEDRHQALVRLENDFGLEMLAVLSKGVSRARVQWEVDGETRAMEISPAGRTRLYKPRRSQGFEMDIEGVGCGSNDRAVVMNRCRFAKIPIIVNGERVSRGRLADNCLVFVPIESFGVEGFVCVPEFGDVTRIIRTSNGIVTDETVLPSLQGLVLTAVVPDGAFTTDEAAATARRAGLLLYEKLRILHSSLDGIAKKRAEALLFERCEQTKDREVMRGVRAFSALGMEPMDLHDIETAMRNEKVFVLDTDAPRFLYDLETGVVLLLDKQERRFLNSVLQVALGEPPRKAGFTSAIERCLSGWRRLRHTAASMLSGLGRPVPEVDLSPEELGFLEALGEEVLRGGFTPFQGRRESIAAVRMVESGRIPWRLGSRSKGAVEFLISRSDRLVQAMVKACSEDSQYLRPALALLSDAAGTAATPLRTSPRSRKNSSASTGARRR